MENISAHPLIMGIINITPDSFYVGSRYNNLKKTILSDFKNASIIDIGCESSRPGAHPVKETDELNRLTSVLNNLIKFDQILSIDTYKPNIARFAMENGFKMINDISAGGENYSMFELAAEYSCPIVIMHMQGTPVNMQKSPSYEDLISEIISFFYKKLEIAIKIGIKESNIILDPGIGFGKSISDNITILNNLLKLKALGCNLLIGISRKSFLSIDGDSAESRLSASLGASVIAIQNGVDILRVHDVKSTYKLISTIKRISSNKEKYLS